MISMKNIFLRLSALLLASLSTLLCSCASSGLAVKPVTHAPGDVGYIPVIGEISSLPRDSAASSYDTSSPATSRPSPLPSSSPVYSLPNYPAPDFLTDQYFIYDVQQKVFLSISGNDRILYPASTTKLLTILYAQTLLPLDRVVKPGNELEMVGKNSSMAYIRINHTLTVEQLIEGMLLPSGNDAAHVLAAEAGRALKADCADGKQAVAVFVQAMNDYAKSIGLCGSVFLSPDGYDNPGHYSTLEDMAIIARLAYEDPVIRKYAAMPSDHVVYHSGHTITWNNSNQCIHPENEEYYLPEVNGLKTGSVSKNNSCIISSAEIDGQSFIFGFFGEKQLVDRFEDTKRAVEWLKTYILI